MSEASDTFSIAIQDAENLLAHFDALNTQPPPPEIEVLKRAGLIMALTAWETYVEDRLIEATERRLSDVTDAEIADFVRSKLESEIKRLHNPDYSRTRKLFAEYARVNLDQHWFWNNFDHATVKQKLSSYLRLRGDVVHRSRAAPPRESCSHPVTRAELGKAIGFFKNLVSATESALAT